MPPGGTYGDKKRLDARLRRLIGPVETAPTRGGLRAVHVGAPAPTRPPGLRPVADGGVLLRAVKADNQARFAAARTLRPLGWSSETPLTAHVDLDTRICWVQTTHVAEVAHDVDGSRCDCARCTDETATVPDLPGTVASSPERVAIDAKGHLCLTDGLLAAVGVTAPAELAVVVVPARHALAVAAPATAIAGRLAFLLPSEETTSSTDRPTGLKAENPRRASDPTA